MIKASIFSIFILGIFLYASCVSKVESVLEGPWSIDTIVYKHSEIRNCLSVNVITFEDILCNLPITRNRCEGLDEYVNSGQWEFYVSDSPPLELKIQTDNHIFSGNYQVIFRKDVNNKLLKLELKSDSLYLVCRKGLFDYDSNIKLINELIEMSHE